MNSSQTYLQAVRAFFARLVPASAFPGRGSLPRRRLARVSAAAALGLVCLGSAGAWAQDWLGFDYSYGTDSYGNAVASVYLRGAWSDAWVTDWSPVTVHFDRPLPNAMGMRFRWGNGQKEWGAAGWQNCNWWGQCWMEKVEDLPSNVIMASGPTPVAGHLVILPRGWFGPGDYLLPPDIRLRDQGVGTIWCTCQTAPTTQPLKSDGWVQFVWPSMEIKYNDVDLSVRGVANGDFNLGRLQGWDTEGGGTAEVVEVAPLSADFAARLTPDPQIALYQNAGPTNAQHLLQFDYRFETANGLLEVVLNDQTVGAYTAPADVASDFSHASVFLAPDFALADVMLQFRFSGTTNDHLLLDNVQWVPDDGPHPPWILKQPADQHCAWGG